MHPTRLPSRPIGVSLVALVVLAMFAAACSSGGGASESPSAAPSAAPTDETPALGERTELTVFTYNVEYGGDETTDAVIRKVDADIVGVLESYNRLPEIARKTGYPYYNVGLQILSKYPIHEPSGSDGLYSLIEVQPGYVVAFFNTHLDYVKYGTKLLVDGMPLDEVIASEQAVRTDSIELLIPDMQRLAAEGYPVFLTGDLNTASHQDYTEETLGMRPGVKVPVVWPTTKALTDAGMVDTYREIYPDPVKVPGITKDNPEFREGGFGDRIDYLFAGGPVTTLDSKLVGEKGGPDVDLGFDPWTSDHRGVLSTFEVTPVAMPTSLSLDRRLLTQGETLNAHVNAPGHSQVQVIVVPEGEDPAAAAETTIIPAPGPYTFDTTDLEPGGYDIVMLGTDAGSEEIARNAFWVRSTKQDVDLTTDKESYASGEPITVTWDDGPANRWDWIGFYEARAPDPREDDYLLWGYTGGHESGALPPQVFGEMVFDENSQGSPWPLPPGKYRIHYLLTDKYASAGFTDITVTE